MPPTTYAEECNSFTIPSKYLAMGMEVTVQVEVRNWLMKQGVETASVSVTSHYYNSYFIPDVGVRMLDFESAELVGLE
eukprot:CAMPEP_0201284826 /NCGR_PEP_ID=MMETSP1317-20130820/85727_1 /ASSEMBLY_ACC=CAM_ASM_000770 /TAXON_ID=187299 /ORGANISM="Undescribed Undescribed, Strain Undescribed" /LENGTH=77 /DNA_ID=CAMNT_0047606521 /DNA_START=134 /DNA_END=364 /DNA_ORIENTATION=-